MHQLINKKKIYFYILSLLFLVTISNNKLNISREEVFLLKNFNIETSSNKLNEKILLKINYLKNKNIFLIKDYEIMSKLKDLNFLEKITVKKFYPSTILISIEETNLLANTFIDQKKYYVGENGEFINSELIENKKKLPTIFGKFQIKEFLNLKKLLSNQNINENKIIKYYFHKNKRWDLYFDNNIIIKLPSKDVSKAINLYQEFKKKNLINPGVIIDLRIKNRIVLKDG